MEIDHITVPVRDYEVGKRFYADVLAPLGIALLLDWHDKRRAYFGRPGTPSSVWVVESPFAGSLDLALAVDGSDDVIAFHNAAVAAGARSVLEPSRSEDRPSFFVARIADFDGNAVEAACAASVAHDLAA